jgi:hypothetical protein
VTTLLIGLLYLGSYPGYAMVPRLRPWLNVPRYDPPGSSHYHWEFNLMAVIGWMFPVPCAWFLLLLIRIHQRLWRSEQDSRGATSSDPENGPYR